MPRVRGLTRPRNLLLFLADDMTFTDLGCYGNPDVRTPHLDRLASEVRLYPFLLLCYPVRLFVQSLFTGYIQSEMVPIRITVSLRWHQIHTHHLRPLGYRVGIVGKHHEAPASAFPFEMLGGAWRFREIARW